jgi:protein-serine/threonine kinase
LNSTLKREQPKVINNYLFGPVVGKGSFGTVKECWSCANAERLAVKIYSLAKPNKGGCLPIVVKAQDLNTCERVHSILNLSACLHHPNVIGVRECLIDESRNKIYCVMDEFCPVSLAKFGKVPKGRNDSQLLLKCIFYQFILGLEYLHNVGVVHKDLKPANVMLSSLGMVKIVDFDVSEVS